MSKDTTNRPTLETVCELLVEEFRTPYIAVPKQTLIEQSPVLLFHVPPGSQRLSELEEGIDSRLEGVETVRIGENEMPISVRHVLYTEVHAFRRVLLYTRGQLGLDDVSLEEGIQRAQKIINGEIDSRSPDSETIALSTLVEELVDAGAAAVELRNESFIHHDLVDLRIPMVPANGYPIAGPYDSVTIDGEEYDFRFDCVLDGPGGYGIMRTPLYTEETTKGLPAVSVEQGLEYLESVRTVAEEHDASIRDTNERLWEVSTKWGDHSR